MGLGLDGDAQRAAWRDLDNPPCSFASRFNLFVDCMPVDDLDEMDQGYLDKITKSALRGDALQPSKYSLDKVCGGDGGGGGRGSRGLTRLTRQVEQEVRYSYKRTMCQLTLLAEMDRHPDVYDLLVARPHEKVGKVSRSGGA